MWVAVTLLSVLGFTAILLCIPLDLEFGINIHRKLDFKARRVWLFGLVKKELKRERRREPESRIEQTRVIFGYPQIKELRRQLRLPLRNILRGAKLEELKVDLTIGTGDPADTAMLYGALCLPALIGNILSPARIT